jgi:glycosyltransferase involved in cell wall biosynthesis
VSNSSFGNKFKKNIKIAYITNTTYPHPAAGALQAITMASAFSGIAASSFFMPDLRTSQSNLKQLYNISDLPLRIQSMHFDRLPSRLRPYYYEFVSVYLRFHPQWARFHGQKILFVRGLKELMFWGLQRERQKWLKDWTFIFEAHDILGLDLNKLQGANPFELYNGAEGEHHQRLLRSLLNFDLIICVTQALADDLKSWSNNKIQPQVIRHASPLARTSITPQIRSFGEKITLGYIGTIDQYRGVHTIVEAMRFLPPNYHLRLVGRIRQEEGINPDWLLDYLKDPLISSRVEWINAVPIHAVPEEIDRCDIVIQPASRDIIDSRYASPLKSYDYMVRGKPIVVADVPCHHELFRNGENGILYQVDPQHLAECIARLCNNPDQAEKIARAGWEQAIEYTYPRRAEKILSLAKHFAKNKIKKNASTSPWRQ